MGWQDRDYYRPPASYGSRVGRFSAWSITTWLIAINIGVFVINALLTGRRLYGPLFFWGHFSAYTAIWNLELWRFITFQFLHADPLHLLFNMLGLYFFGTLIEDYLGRARYLAFYLICGMAGAGTYLVLWRLGILGTDPRIPLVGASAGIFGILIAAARIAPNITVMLMFPPIPMRLRTLAWVLFGLALFTILTGGRNAGGEAAHLGGALMGLLLIQYPRTLNVFAFRWRRGPSMRYRP